MKIIRHTATLFYYDGPQVFEGRDEIGGYYIGVMVEPEQGTTCDRYLIAGVSPERLRMFRNGTLDLRALILERNDGDWYLAKVETSLAQPLQLNLRTDLLIETDFLPEPGFTLHDRPALTEALQEARAQNNLVLEIAVEPPESAADHRIRMGTLANLLEHWQSIIKHAYASALRKISDETRKHINASDAHCMDVIIPAAPGSFRILLSASQPTDMLGQSELKRALEIVDKLFSQTTDPQKTLECVKESKGHLANAYIRLLRFLVQSKTGLRYAWAEPGFTQARALSISESDAQPLVEALSAVSNLIEERTILVGKLMKIDVDRRTWRIKSSDGEHAGYTEETGPSLSGLITDSLTYRFTCIEELAEQQGSGREIRKLRLIEYEPA